VLALPSEGLKQPVNEHHKVDEDLLCDWIEANVLFDQPAVSGAEFVDLLMEQQYYVDQRLAWQLFDMLSFKLQQRMRVLGDSYPLKLTDRLIECRGSWQEFLPYSFCLALSLARPFASWAAGFGQNFTEQGDLFEQLSVRSLALLLPRWSIHRTGWSNTEPRQLRDVVQRLASVIGAKVGNLDDWAPEKGKDGELDVACVFEFPDARGSHMVYLTQCASGKNWPSKLHTPRLEMWQKLIDFTVQPARCFTMPYALSDRQFRTNALTVQGLFLDRLRLLVPGRDNRTWLPQELSRQIEHWVATRVESLPGI
jgi:hypothetical protein